jgi:hypothetical protein
VKPFSVKQAAPQEPIDLTEVVSVNYKAFIISTDKDEDLMPVEVFIQLNSDRIV